MSPRTGRLLPACLLGLLTLCARADDSIAIPRIPHPGGDQIFYFACTDRFYDGDTSNNTGGLTGTSYVTGFDPTASNMYHGGDLRGVVQKLDYLQGLGITQLWLTPLFKNKVLQAGTASYHGYWIQDFLNIDPHLGANSDLTLLADSLHDRGLRLTLDIVVNHTADIIYNRSGQYGYLSLTGYPYRDGSGATFAPASFAYNGQNTAATFPPLSATSSFPYQPITSTTEANAKNPAWLNDLTHYHNRGNANYTGEDFTFGEISGLDDLFTEQPDVVKGMQDIYAYWITNYNIDGFRIDTVKHVNRELWQSFAPAMRAAADAAGNPSFLQFGEVYNGDPAFLSEWSTDACLDATLDFGFAYAARNFVSQTGSSTNLNAFFANDDYYTDFDSNVHSSTTFLGNHDMGRFGYFLRVDNATAGDTTLLQLMKLGHALLLFSRGQPVIYYGDEQGLSGVGGDASSRQDMAASQTVAYQSESLIGTTRTGRDDKFDTSHPLYQTLAAMTALRRSSPALLHGAQLTRVTGQANLAAFSRLERDERIEYLVTFNNSRDSTLSASLPTAQPAGASFACVFDSQSPLAVPSAPLITDTTGHVAISLDPLQCRVWKAASALPSSSGTATVQLTHPSAGSTLSFNARTTDGSTFAGRAFLEAATNISDFAELSFALQRSSRPDVWEILGTDDTPPYRIAYRPPSDMAPGEHISIMVTANDCRGRRVSATTSNITLNLSGNNFGISGATIPALVSAPQSLSVAAGSDAALEVSASGSAPFRYQWFRDGELLPAATSARLLFIGASTSDAASYRVQVSNLAGSIMSPVATLAVTGTPPASGRLINLSARTQTGIGDRTLIVGFVIKESQASVLVRAIGPSLDRFKLHNLLPDPSLHLYQSTTVIHSNDNWTLNDGRSLGAFELGTGTKDAVLTAQLNPGPFTAHITGSAATEGMALAEIYDADTSSLGHMINLSTRSFVGTGDNVLIAGFVTSGAPKRLLIRGIGPALRFFDISGVLRTPVIRVYNSTHIVIAQNASWFRSSNAAQIYTVCSAIGAFSLPRSSNDAAILVSIPPGPYSVVMSGANDSTGIGMIEVYDADL